MIRPVVEVNETNKTLEFWCVGCHTRHAIPLTRYSWDRSTTRPTVVPMVRVRDQERVCECQITAGVAHYSLETFHSFAGRLVPLEDIA